ncbi:MAG: tetratricopeptide repeat protein [Terriglobia bacterium]
MTSTTIRRCVQALVVAAVFAGATPLLAQTGGVTGSAKDAQGNICAGYPIIIERQDVKGTYKTKTSKKGKYVYIGLPIGEYKIILDDPSGKQLFYITRHIGLGDPTEVDFDLHKEMQQQAKNPEVEKAQAAQQQQQKAFQNLSQIYTQGNTLYTQGDYAGAAAMFEKAVPMAKGKNLGVVLSRTADAYGKAKQYDKAIEFYQKAIALTPADAGLYTNLGNVYANMNKIPEAEAQYEKAAQLDPTHAAQAYYNIGAVMTNTGHMAEAAAAFKKATEVDPKYADAYFLEAQALVSQAKTGADGKIIPAPGTVEALQDYLKVAPTGKYAAQAQAMLQSLTGQVQTQYKKSKR